MKKLSLLCIAVCISLASMGETQWVDLGLASGTLWASAPEEECYTYEDAKATFGVHLPTQWQWTELYQSCELEKFFTKEKKGVLFTGINGNSIFVPTVDAVDENGKKPKDTYKTAFWCFSTMAYNTKQAYSVSVGSEQYFMPGSKKYKLSVLQVKK